MKKKEAEVPHHRLAKFTSARKHVTFAVGHCRAAPYPTEIVIERSYTDGQTFCLGLDAWV